MEKIDVAAAGWQVDGLRRVVEFAESCNTAQLTICHRRGLLTQAVFDPTPVDVYAVQKGLLSCLFAIAEDKYLLEISDPVNHHLDPEWTHLSPQDEAMLTIEILLNMTTGMNDELGPEGKIGETWRYNNIAYNYLKKILCLAADRSLNDLTRAWLLEPLGMENTRWVERDALLPDGTPLTGLFSTADDLVRLGLMILNDGFHKGVEMVPRYYLDRISQPGSEQNPAWGLCWWNNKQESYKVPMREEKTYSGSLTPNAPADLISARGARENYLYVLPSLELVIARTTNSKKQDSGGRFEKQFWNLLLESAP